MDDVPSLRRRAGAAGVGMTAHPPLALVVVVAENGVIGADNRLLWHLRTDLQRFKALTLGKPLLMGRRTFDSIGKPLPGRETIVLTRDRAFGCPGVHAAHDLEAAIAACAASAARLGADEIMVAGGAEIFRLTLGLAAKLHVTEVALSPPGDVYFPPLDRGVWRETARTAHPAGPQDEVGFVFVDYARRAEQAG